MSSTLNSARMTTRLVALLAAACFSASPASAADGDPDPSFSGDGFQTHNCGSSELARDVAVQPDGKIVVVGETEIANSDFCIARFTADGTLDPHSGLRPRATPTPSTATGTPEITFGADETPFSVAIQADGRIVVAGDTNAPSGGGTDPSDFAIARLNQDGTLDTTFHDVPAPTPFDGDGKQSVDIGSVEGGAESDDHAADVIVEPDGNIFVVGDQGSDFAMLRLVGNGLRDGEFGGNGVRVGSLAGSARAREVVRQADGKYVIAGETSAGGSPDNFVILRTDAAGEKDPSFGEGDGLADTHIDFGEDDEVDGLVQLPDGRFIVVGETDLNQDMALAALTPNGQPDPNCDGDGRQSRGLRRQRERPRGGPHR